MKHNLSNITTCGLALAVAAFVALPLHADPPGPPPGPPGDTMKSLQEIWDEIATLKAQNAVMQEQLNDILAAVVTENAVAIEMVTVANPGNAADTTGEPNPAGAVANEYKIGRYEVTNEQYAQFLNAVAATDTNNLYNTNMGSNVRGGITRIGAPGNYGYGAKAAMGDKPVNYVCWYDAVRFCNWLHNGRPTGVQDATTTEGGTYTLTGERSIAAGTDPTHGANGRNTGAKFWLPSENEWYKAAYHQPAGQGGDADNYWLYPTQSNAAPTVAIADVTGNISNDNGNIANYNFGVDWNEQNGNVTTVGSGGPGSASFYGAFDMGGNVWEWNEQNIGGFRGLRGSSWKNFSPNSQQSSYRGSNIPEVGLDDFGFRIAGP